MKLDSMTRMPLRLLISLLVCISSVLSAAEYGDFTYEIVDETTVTITAYSISGPSDVEIPAEIEGLPVTSIGDGVFRASGPGPSRGSITSVDIPSSVTSIGDFAFYYCQGLTSISIPSSIMNIGDFAFHRTGLTSLDIPSSVTSIGDNAFGSCTSLTSITVALGNSAYSSIDGALFNLPQTSLLQVAAGETGVYSIPSSVTTIGYGAFIGCFRLTSVSINNGVTSIEKLAFKNCNGLTSISLPASVASLELGVFDSCSNLTDITVEQGNLNYSSIDGVLFDLTQSTLIKYPASKVEAYSIPDSVTSIGDRAFYDGNLTSCSIPDSVTSIGGSAFFSCGSLTSISIPDSVTSIGSSAFFDCSGLTSIGIGSRVTSLGSWAFRNCSLLTSVSIPGSVTSIGDYAFSGCEGLTSVNIEHGVMSIGQGAFRSCSSLTSISIPDSVTSIGSYAFFFSVNLRSTYFLGDAPASFGTGVFAGVANDHIIYYFDASTGFTSPTWNGHATEMIDASQYPRARWLVTANLPHDAELNQDLNGDGVSLLMAYALNLNPNDHLAGELPQAELTPDALQLQFHGSETGVSYQVKASRDLADWETLDVDLSEPDSEGIRTATIPRGDDRGFLKLVVEEE